MIRIALHGAGRMAEAVLRSAASQDDIEICAVVAPNSPQWEVHLSYLSGLEHLTDYPDVLVDFSLPDGTAEAADWCGKTGVALLSGVTGLHERARKNLAEAAKTAAVLWSPNMSIGVNLLARLCAEVARHVPVASPILVEDVHHQWKVDAPSGTALMLGETIQQARPQAAAPIAYTSERTGEVIGEHKVTFEFPGEQLTLTHVAENRDIFASGSLAAARWLNDQTPGNYTAMDWLGGS